jgi:monothiol glutaredoxin
MSDTQQRIDALVKSNDVLLFMKGSASFPHVRLLGPCHPDPESLRRRAPSAVDRERAGGSTEIRQGIKDYSNWPTIPQLYVKGEFIGGSDIMMEMYESGELQQVLGSLT